MHKTLILALTGLLTLAACSSAPTPTPTPTPTPPAPTPTPPAPTPQPAPAPSIQPLPNTPVAGTLSVVVQVSEATPLVKAELFVDDVKVGQRPTTAGTGGVSAQAVNYTFEIDTAQRKADGTPLFYNGTHTIRVRTTGTDGTTSEDSETVTFANKPALTLSVTGKNVAANGNTYYGGEALTLKVDAVVYDKGANGAPLPVTSTVWTTNVGELAGGAATATVNGTTVAVPYSAVNKAALTGGEVTYGVTVNVAGGQSNTGTLKIRVDDAAPALVPNKAPVQVKRGDTARDIVASEFLNGTDTFVANYADAGVGLAPVRIDALKGAVNAKEGATTGASLGEGTGYTVKPAVVADLLGNAADLSNVAASAAFGVDLGAPTVTPALADGVTYNNTVATGTTVIATIVDPKLTGNVDASGLNTVAVKFTPVDGAAVSVTGTLAANGQLSLSNVDLNALPDGGYAVAVTATDKAGNTTTVTRNVVLDKTAPVATFTAPLQTSFNGTGQTSVKIDVTGSVVDTVALKSATLKVYVDADGNNTFDASKDTLLGANEVNAYDSVLAAGNFVRQITLLRSNFSGAKTYFFVIDAADNAKTIAGADAPNTAQAVKVVTVTW